MLSEELVTIFTTDSVVVAASLKSRLVADGIKVFLADENIVGAHGLLANAVGGIKVQVAAKDVEIALPIVQAQSGTRTPSKSRSVDTGWGECPKCESKNLAPFRKALGWKGIFLLLGFLLVKPHRMLKCNSCEYVWKYR